MAENPETTEADKDVLKNVLAGDAVLRKAERDRKEALEAAGAAQ